MHFVNNEEFEKTSEQNVNDNVVDLEERKNTNREFFAFWNVDGESYRLKLTTPKITELESRYKCNLISLMGDSDRLPSLTTMLQVTHAAMEPWAHGIKLKNVESIYDKYIASGGSMLQFYVEVFMKIYNVSGFFSHSMAEDMDDAVEKLSGNM